MRIILTFIVFAICVSILLFALCGLIDLIGWLLTRDKKEERDKS